MVAFVVSVATYFIMLLAVERLVLSSDENEISTFDIIMFLFMVQGGIEYNVQTAAVILI